MTHAEAVDSMAAERYTLDEMASAERSAFETHYFDCTVCAENVRLCDAVAEGLKGGRSMMDFTPVKLKNGGTEVPQLVAATMLVLESLFEEMPIVFYELVMCAQDPGHQPFGSCGDELRKRALLGFGNYMHGSLRNIVLSAASIDGPNIKLGNPVMNP